MKMFPTACPSCWSRLAVKRLRCEKCETEVEGLYRLPPLLSLTPEDQEFTLQFVRASGSLKEMATLLKVSYPTVRNRLDEIILFHKLSRKDMDRIVDIQVARLAKLLADRKIEIELDGRARDWLAAAGYDPVYGARPLKRVIQRRLQDPLAQLLLEGELGDGGHVKVSAGKSGLIINDKSFDASEDSRDEPALPSHAIH